MRFALSSLFLLLLIPLVSFDSKQSKKLFVPPGTVAVNDAFYFDKTEISNSDWREYEVWTKQKYGESSPEHKRTIPR